MIALCYVKGIDEVDTPYFLSETTQQGFFSSKIVWSDETAYYPPYFMNTIRLSSSDVPLNDASKRVNYCYLDYEGKTFYYFIDSIDYVTDDLYEIHISMDTIQTYMFNVKVTKPTISRKAIKRFGDDTSSITINRSYIRENLSDGKKRKTLKNQLFSSESTFQWLVVKASENFLKERVNPNSSIPSAEVRPSYAGNVSYDGLAEYGTYGGCYYLIPYGDWVFKGGEALYVKMGDTYTLIDDIYTLLKSILSDDRVVSARLIPMNPFAFAYKGSDYNGKPCLVVDKITFSVNAYDSESQPVVTSYDWYPMNLMGLTSTGNPSCLALTFPDISVSTYARSFADEPEIKLVTRGSVFAFTKPDGKTFMTRNMSKGVAYDSRYVPAMIDESYMEYDIGDNGGTSMLPARYATALTTYHKTGVTLDGARVYSWLFNNVVGNDYGNALKDPFNTLLVSDNALDFDLYTSPWKNYQMTHKGSIVTDWVATGANSIAKMAGGMAMAHLTQPSSPQQYGSQFQGLAMTAYNGYKTGFAKYRTSYSGRQRDPETGRFVSRAYTYTGGNY